MKNYYRRAHMEWVQVSVNIGEHPKTRRLARLLGVTVEHAVGQLVLFWAWVWQYCNSGDLGPMGGLYHEELEDRWPGLVEALITAGLIDYDGDRLVVHDWDQYSWGAIQARREKAALAAQARWGRRRNGGEGRGEAQRGAQASAVEPAPPPSNPTPPIADQDPPVEEVPRGSGDMGGFPALELGYVWHAEVGSSPIGDALRRHRHALAALATAGVDTEAMRRLIRRYREVYPDKPLNGAWVIERNLPTLRAGPKPRPVRDVLDYSKPRTYAGDRYIEAD